jgi:hypothetical protein
VRSQNEVNRGFLRLVFVGPGFSRLWQHLVISKWVIDHSWSLIPAAIAAAVVASDASAHVDELAQ